MAVFKNFFKRGKDPLMSEIADHTFEDTAAEFNKKVKDMTFVELTNVTWADKNKSATPTYVDKTKN